MTRCLVAHCNGTREEVACPHSQISAYLQGPVCFVGAMHDINAIAVARVQDDDSVNKQPINPIPTRLLFDATPIYGNIVFVASDDEGEEIDLDVEALLTWLDEHT